MKYAALMSRYLKPSNVILRPINAIPREREKRETPAEAHSKSGQPVEAEEKKKKNRKNAYILVYEIAFSH